nr:hypothetical protein [Tanacetum cinerariifolium]
MQKSSSSTSYVPPSRNDWDLLFQPLFDELLNPPPSVDNQAAEVIAPINEVIPQVDDDSTGSPSSTKVDQDAPSLNNSCEGFQVQQAEGFTAFPFLPISAVHVSTWLQLHEQALFCYYDAFLTSVEPKTYKEALTQACWIAAIQEELNEFERLEVTYIQKRTKTKQNRQNQAREWKEPGKVKVKVNQVKVKDEAKNKEMFNEPTRTHLMGRVIDDFQCADKNNNTIYKYPREATKSKFLSESFFIISSIAVQTPGSGISNLLEVGTTFTGSGNFYCKWELSPGRLSQVEARLVEFKNPEIKFCEKIRGLEFKVESEDNRIERLTKELKELKKEKKGLDSKLTGFQSASKDLDTLLGSQRPDKNKEGPRYSVVPPPAQVYSPPKKDMSWAGLPEFADDTITDYSRPSPSVESNSNDLQSSNSSVSEHVESSKSIMSKPMIKFVKAADCPGVIKNNKTKTARESPVKYAEMYKNTSKSPKVRGN